MILIFGATGRTGGELVKQLVLKNESIRVFTRNSEKKAEFEQRGIEVATGDASDVTALKNAFKGITKVYLLLANSQHQLTQEKLITDCAKEAKVELIVKQSSLETLNHMAKPIPQVHINSEAYIKASGLNWVMIRPSFFNQILLTCAHAIKANNTLVFPMNNGCVAFTDTRDVAEVAAVVLTENGHNNKSYDLSGTEVLSFDTVAALFSKVLNKDISYVNQPIEQYQAILASMFEDKWRVNAICEELKALATGSVKHLAADNIEKLLGRPPRTVHQFIEDYKAAFV